MLTRRDPQVWDRRRSFIISTTAKTSSMLKVWSRGDRIRSRRKLEHLNIARRLDEHPYTSGLEDVHLVHNSVPELDLDEIDTAVTFLGRKLSLPLIINAMTGGIKEALDFNRDISELGVQFNIGIAVGSQTIALENRQLAESFKIVRKVNPGGLILANVAANTEPQMAVRAAEMIEANGLQLHLNVPQELAMREGDRKFKGLKDNIAEIVRISPVPVIAKEVGFGMSRETARQLFDLGVHILDLGGRGAPTLSPSNRPVGCLADEFTSGEYQPQQALQISSLNLQWLLPGDPGRAGGRKGPGLGSRYNRNCRPFSSGSGAKRKKA